MGLESSQPTTLIELSRNPSRVDKTDSMRKFDAIFFDFDGVLIISESIWWSVIKEVLRKHGRAIRLRVDGLKLSTVIGLQIPDNKKLAARVEKKVRKRAVRKIKKQSLTDDKGIRQVLDQIHSKGIKMGVVSSSDRRLVDYVLRRHAIRRYFSVIVGGDDVENGKPAPDGYEVAAMSLGITDPGRCCAVEDSSSGIEAAAAAGMHVIQFIVRNERAEFLAISFSDVSRTILGDAQSKLDS